MPTNVFNFNAACVSRTDPEEQCHILEDCNINIDLMTTHKVIKVCRMNGDKDLQRRLDVSYQLQSAAPLPCEKEYSISIKQGAGWVLGLE